MEEVTRNPLDVLIGFACRIIDRINWVEAGFFLPVFLMIVVMTLTRWRRNRLASLAAGGKPKTDSLSDPARLLIDRIRQGIDRCGMFKAADSTSWYEIIFGDRMVRVRTTKDDGGRTPWSFAVADGSAEGGWRFLVGVFPFGDDSKEIIRAATDAYDSHLAVEAVAGLISEEPNNDKNPCDCEDAAPGRAYAGEYVTSVRVADDGRLRVATANPPDVSYYRLPSDGLDELQIQRIVGKEMIRQGVGVGLGVGDVRQLVQEAVREAMEARPASLSANDTMKLVQAAIRDDRNRDQTKVTMEQVQDVIRAWTNGEKFRDAVHAVARGLVTQTVQLAVGNALAARDLERKPTTVKISEPAKPESIDYDKLTVHFVGREMVYKYGEDTLETGAVVAGLPGILASQSAGPSSESGEPSSGPSGSSSGIAPPVCKPATATSSDVYQCICDMCVASRAAKSRKAEQSGT